MMGTYYENCVFKDRGAQAVKGHRPQYENKRKKYQKGSGSNERDGLIVYISLS